MKVTFYTNSHRVIAEISSDTHLVPVPSVGDMVTVGQNADTGRVTKVSWNMTGNPITVAVVLEGRFE